MKKITAIILFLCMSFGFTTSCAAVSNDDSAAAEIVLQIGNAVMTVDGAEQAIDEGGTVPVIVNGRTLLPVRTVVEAMGGAVDWDGVTQTVTLDCGDDEIILVINETSAYLNGELQALDTATAIINDRTMLPIRFIAESFGYNVEWNGDDETVTITKIQTADEPANTKTSDNFVLINGGTFEMGSASDEPERGEDEVLHEVTVASFYMSATELTQAEYEAIIGSNPSENIGENLPVENVTWYDAIEYCNARSEAEGLTPCYTISDNTVTWDKTSNGYRLPTEAEWEYAARANTATPFSFGDYVYDDDANCYNAYGYNNDSTGNWVNDYLGYTVDVTSYNANAYGLYNMHGNVSEWVWDWYGEYDTADTDNPTGPDSGVNKIARGGGWNDMPKHIRSAYRIAFPVDVPLYSIGIRLVRNAEPSTGTVQSVYNGKASQETGKVLIAYFSQTGNTKGFAEIIEEMTGADVFRIERATPYSAASNSQILHDEALTEQRENAMPELAAYLEDAGYDIDNYDTILLGYSNWWASIPAPVASFVSYYDLSGKTIIPFCSMGGGRFGQTISAIAKIAAESVIKEGLTVTYSSYNRDEIYEWLVSSGINAEN